MIRASRSRTARQRGPSEVKGRIVDYTLSARGGIVIKIDKGQKAGVAKGWKGQVVDRAGNPIEGGSFKVVRVTKRESQGKVKLSVDQVKSNTRVLLTP